MGTPKSPVLTGARVELSIYQLSYRSARGRRKRMIHWLRVPYAGLFALSEVMDRALARGKILDYRIASALAITPEIRLSMTRWPEALATDPSVNWEA